MHSTYLFCIYLKKGHILIEIKTNIYVKKEVIKKDKSILKLFKFEHIIHNPGYVYINQHIYNVCYLFQFSNPPHFCTHIYIYITYPISDTGKILMHFNVSQFFFLLLINM